MDPTDLFKQLKPILEPTLDFLEQVAGKTADQAAKQFGVAAWKALTRLWVRLRSGVGRRPAGAEALEDLHEDPADPDNRAALMKQVRKVIAKDAEIQSVLADVLASGTLTSVQSAVADHGGRVIQGGPGSANVGGSHHGDTYIYNTGISQEMLGLLERLVPQNVGPEERADIARGYLRFLDERYRYLEFKGMGAHRLAPGAQPVAHQHRTPLHPCTRPARTRPGAGPGRPGPVDAGDRPRQGAGGRTGPAPSLGRGLRRRPGLRGPLRRLHGPDARPRGASGGPRRQALRLHPSDLHGVPGLRDLGTGGVTADCFERTRGALLDRLRAREGVPAPMRIECGEVLADLGDPRSEVTTLDGMQFCLVPAGGFFLGSTDDDPDARDNEKQGAGEHRIG